LATLNWCSADLRLVLRWCGRDVTSSSSPSL
jgi:hypothetical protein